MIYPSRFLRLLPLVALILTSLLFSLSAKGEDALLERYVQLKNGEFSTLPGTRISIVSSEQGKIPSAEVTSILPIPFDDVSTALGTAGNWCQFMPLHFNIKACTYQHQDNREAITVYSGRKDYQLPEESYQITYRFENLKQDDGQLSLRLHAKKGPANTRDYRISLDARRVEEGTLLYMQSSYRPSLLSTFLAHSYLATFGYDKVGFSLTQQNGERQLVKGIRGVIERNVMRYHLAIDAYLSTRHLSPDSRHEAALMKWFSENEQFSQQLHEMSRTEYLSTKRKEWQNQQQLQQMLDRKSQLVALP